MASCRVTASVKPYPLRPLIFYMYCLSCAAFVCAVAFYTLLLSSGASMVYSLASFIPKPGLLSSACTSAGIIELDRGSELFHSWSDQELFERAVSAETMRISMQVRPDDESWMRAGNSGRLRGSSVLLKSDNPSLFASSPSPHRDDFSACQKDHHLINARTGKMKSKVAFLFLTRGPLPFLPLWSRFFDGYEDLYNIYVHLDPFRVGVFDRNNSGVFWGRLIPPGLTERGAPSLAAAGRRLLANALLHDPLNHYFAVLSESCIPLVSFPSLHDRLTASAERSFIEILGDAPTLEGRYASRGGEAAMLPEVPFSSFRVGSQFFVLTRKHAAMVVSDYKIWSKFNTPCLDENACYAEEHYFPTLIDMEDGMCATGFTVTNVDWSSEAWGHPRTYEQGEVTRELIVTLRGNSTSFLFARKFADTCLEPLLQLAPFLLEEEDL